MLLLVAHRHFLRRVRCHTLHVRSRNVSPSRPVHGTDGPVLSTGPIVFDSCLATYLPHLVTEEEHNIKFLARVITKDALTVRYGNNTTQTKFRAGKGMPPFAALYKAKFWQEEGWDTVRRQVARQRHAAPSTQASQDGILTVKVDIVGVDRTVAFVKDWKTVEDQALTLNAVLVLCSKNTAYCCEGLEGRMEALTSTNLAIIIVGRRPEVTSHVDTLLADASGKGRKAVLIPLTVDPNRHNHMWDTLFPYSPSPPEGSRADRRSSHRSPRLTVAVIYPLTLHKEHRKFPAALQYTHLGSMKVQSFTSPLWSITSSTVFCSFQ